MDVIKEDGTIITASINEITVIQNNQKANVVKVGYEPSSVAVSQENHVAVGGTVDNKVHIYELKGSALTRDLQLTHLGPVTDVSYSPDDKYLVACDANRKVILYSVPEYKVNKVLQLGHCE